MACLYLTMLIENSIFFSLQPIYKLFLFWIIINCWRSVINFFVLQDRLHSTAHSDIVAEGNTYSKISLALYAEGILLCTSGTKVLMRPNCLIQIGPSGNLSADYEICTDLHQPWKDIFSWLDISGAGQYSQPGTVVFPSLVLGRCQPMYWKSFSHFSGTY